MRLLTRSKAVGNDQRSTASTKWIGLAAIGGAMLLAAPAAIGSAVWEHQQLGARSRALAARAEAVEREASRIAAYRRSVDQLGAELTRRQEFIERMVDAHLADLPEPAGDRAGSPGGTQVERNRAADRKPEAPALATVEARQLALVARLTRFADYRARADEQRIRKLGLSPRMLIAGDREAQGGPLQRLATEADGSVDPRFRRLGANLARMEALERGLAGVPQVLPAKYEFMSSGFGYRSDPFDGSAAFHAGLDFAGPVGAPIYAAARGTVSFAGQRNGYGNCVEIDHGNGLVTRYAHMSRLRAHVGEKVAAGAVIGALGSTGRSTGPHLHFEVRVHDQPVNPRPFLEEVTRQG